MQQKASRAGAHMPTLWQSYEHAHRGDIWQLTLTLEATDVTKSKYQGQPQWIKELMGHITSCSCASHWRREGSLGLRDRRGKRAQSWMWRWGRNREACAACTFNNALAHFQLSQLSIFTLNQSVIPIVFLHCGLLRKM